MSNLRNMIAYKGLEFEMIGKRFTTTNGKCNDCAFSEGGNLSQFCCECPDCGSYLIFVEIEDE